MASFHGSGLRASYQLQSEVVAKLNNQNDHQKAAWKVLGNLAPEDRQKLDASVVALKNWFGTAYQTETMLRMKFQNRVKQRDESLQKVTEDKERLIRLLHHDAPPMYFCVISLWMSYWKRTPADEAGRKDHRHCGGLTKLLLSSDCSASQLDYDTKWMVRRTKLLGSQTSPAAADRKSQARGIIINWRKAVYRWCPRAFRRMNEAVPWRNSSSG